MAEVETVIAFHQLAKGEKFLYQDTEYTKVAREWGMWGDNYIHFNPDTEITIHTNLVT